MEIQKIRLGNVKIEYEDWKSKSHLERLNMLETLRRQYIVGIDQSKKYEIRKVRIK